jgi:hypothetical protein
MPTSPLVRLSTCPLLPICLYPPLGVASRYVGLKARLPPCICQITNYSSLPLTFRPYGTVFWMLLGFLPTYCPYRTAFLLVFFSIIFLIICNLILITNRQSLISSCSSSNPVNPDSDKKHSVFATPSEEDNVCFFTLYSLLPTPYPLLLNSMSNSL